MKRYYKQMLSSFTALSMTFGMCAFNMNNVKAADVSDDNSSSIVFSDTTAELKSGVSTGFTIKGTTVTISSAGTYVFSGSCTNGNIEVKKNTSDVKIILNGLDLTASATAPIVCGKSTSTEVIAADNTVNSLSDTADDSEEGAAIKVKSASSLALSGTGTLNITGVYKNGIKGAAETNISVKEQNLNITSADTGLGSDNSVTVDSGTIKITSGGDGIKSSPDDDDTVSTGDVTLNNGSVTIVSTADGIQADNNLTINNGTYIITANKGYTTALSSDSDSCKGLKAENTLSINNGTFTINSADDAIHSKQIVTINNGKLDIQTGDDAVHADTTLNVGTTDGTSQPEINITNSYEALESGTVNIYNGSVTSNSSDDGINAGGGDGSASNNPGRPGDGFNPGTMGQPGGTPPAGNEDSSYGINISGGDVKVTAAGDGLDSNGYINISGGNVQVYGAAAGSPTSDNSPFDHDSSFVITGGNVFGAGSSQMAEAPSAASTQKYITSTDTYESGTIINILDSSKNVIFTTTLAEKSNYIIYSSDKLKSNETYSFETGSIPDTPTPAKVKTLKIGASTVSSIGLKWTTAANADGYQLYKYDTSTKKYTLVKTTTAASYTDKSLKAGTIYKYRVRAYAKDGASNIYGSYSSVLTASTKPANTKISKISSSKKVVTVTWKNVTGSGYELYYAANSSFTKSKKIISISGSTKSSVKIKKLTAGKTYYVKLRAVRNVNGTKYYSAFSKVSKITVK